MGKKEDLETLDRLVRKKMIDCLNGGKTDMLPELNPVVSYLAKNNVVSEKTKSTVEEDTAKRIADAKKRRDAKKLEDDLDDL